MDAKNRVPTKRRSTFLQNDVSQHLSSAENSLPNWSDSYIIKNLRLVDSSELVDNSDKMAKIGHCF